MDRKVLSLEEIIRIIKPLAEKYHFEEIYLFGSYARGESTADSDLDFLVIGGAQFKKTNIFALGYELSIAFDKEVDAYELCEIIPDSELYRNIMKDRVLLFSQKDDDRCRSIAVHSTYHWLDTIEEMLAYNAWYLGR